MFSMVILYVLLINYASSQTLQCQLAGGASCPTRICPNTPVQYICNVGSYAGNTQWNISSMGSCNASKLKVNQGSSGSGLSCLNSSSNASCGLFTVTNLPSSKISLYCLTSILSVVVIPATNGVVISCSSISVSSFTTIPIGNTSISVITLPSVPSIESLASTHSSITVNWTSVPTATSYNVSINGSTPISLPANANTYTLTGLTSSTIYTVSVMAINCAGNSSAATARKKTGIVDVSQDDTYDGVIGVAIIGILIFAVIFIVCKFSRNKYKCKCVSRGGPWAKSGQAIARSHTSAEDPNFTDKNVVKALKDVVEWKSLGDQLNISAPKIKEIDADNRGQVGDCRRALVQYWLESDASCSWKKLIDALKAMDKAGLAEEIIRKYCPMYQGDNIGAKKGDRSGERGPETKMHEMEDIHEVEEDTHADDYSNVSNDGLGRVG